MISHELAQRITSDECLVMSLDPGTVNTKMLLSGWGPCGISVNSANDEYILSTSPFDSKNHGKYFVGTKISNCRKDVYNNEKRVKLWNELERICNVKYS